VIIPTYKDAEFLPSAIGSVNVQSYAPVEIIIIDSSAISWVKDYCEQHDHCKYIYEPPSNVATARNLGINKAEGKYIAFLDADDWWRHDKLTKQIPLLEDGADIVYSDHYVVSDGDVSDGTSLPIENPGAHYIDYFWNNDVPSRTVITRAECLKQENFNESLDASEDWDLWVRLFYEFTPARVPQPLAYKLVRNDSLTSDVDAVHQSKIESIREITARYDELRPYKEERLAMIRSRYAEMLLQIDEKQKARRLLKNILLTDGLEYIKNKKFVLVCILSLLPIKFGTVEFLNEKLNLY
jgi:glycosyltransferase involved in cell wall biosynthesis